MSPERLRRFFTREQATYRINKSIRDLCVFAKQDLVADPPFSRIDLISCRNVLIYFTPALQRQVIPTFHYALNPNGFLVLGASETIGSFAGLFSVVDPKNRIYAKKATGLRQYAPFHNREILAGEPADVLAPPSVASVDWQRAADSFVLKEYAPVGVLVNDDLDILQFRGQTGDYLTPPPGEPCHNVLKMAREGLLLPLRDALRECREEGSPVRRTGVQVRGAGMILEIDLRVIPIKPYGSGERCLLVLFEAPGANRRARRGLLPARPDPGARPTGCPAPLPMQRPPAMSGGPRSRTIARSSGCGMNSTGCATTSSPSSSNMTPSTRS